MQIATCPIWGTPAEEYAKTRDGRDFNSPRAGGRYAVSENARLSWPPLDYQQKERLTQWLADERRAGTENPLITSDVLTSVTG
jgi:hypothetical protein